eukprot:1158344-Pelagomonas_calceolata.AAC.22
MPLQQQQHIRHVCKRVGKGCDTVAAAAAAAAPGACAPCDACSSSSSPPLCCYPWNINHTMCCT